MLGLAVSGRDEARAALEWLEPVPPAGVPAEGAADPVAMLLADALGAHAEIAEVGLAAFYAKRQASVSAP